VLLNRKLLAIAAALILFSAIAVAVLTGSFSGGKKEDTNVAEIYLLSWDLNTKDAGKAIDVEFRISIDTDNDGVYDQVRTSEVFRNTSVETAPFRLGSAIPTSVGEFTFKVEALQVNNGSLMPMNYHASGSVPVNSGINEQGFSQSWKYDGTSLELNGSPTCRISYACYVDSRS
jgi:hypothetical protein